MILSDATIKAYLDSGKLAITPFNPDHVQPASVDLTLGTHFLEVDTSGTEAIRLDSEIKYRSIDSENMIIPPRSFLLATTAEYVAIPNGLSAFVEGRSSIGRMGLFIQNAGWVDAGFEGQITLELFNANNLPIRLSSGRRICQLVFCKMDRDAEVPYKGKYFGQRNSVGSRVFLDTEITKTAS